VIIKDYLAASNATVKSSRKGAAYEEEEDDGDPHRVALPSNDVLPSSESLKYVKII
jgi:hypothetical protein